MQNKDVRYTPSGQRRMESLQEDIRSQIEEILERHAYIPGEDVVEVTAGDVDEVARSLRIQVQNRRHRAHLYRRLIIRVYMIMGALLVFAGLFFDTVRVILDDPLRATILAGGIAMLLAGLTLEYLTKRRMVWASRLGYQDELTLRPSPDRDGEGEREE